MYRNILQEETPSCKIMNKCRVTIILEPLGCIQIDGSARAKPQRQIMRDQERRMAGLHILDTLRVSIICHSATTRIPQLKYIFSSQAAHDDNLLDLLP